MASGAEGMTGRISTLDAKREVESCQLGDSALWRGTHLDFVEPAAHMIAND